MMAANPMVQNNPQMQALLNNPQALQTLFNPNTINALVQLEQLMGGMPMPGRIFSELSLNFLCILRDFCTKIPESYLVNS